MKIVFVSNYLNPHQLPTCQEYIKQLGEDSFHFITCTPFDQESITKGFSDLNTTSKYIIRAYESEALFKMAKKLSIDADVMIFGSGNEKLFELRMKHNKFTFRYSERLYKTKFNIYNWVRRLLGSWLHHGRFQKKQVYMLCASAYTASDLAIFKNYIGRTYKWGYFPLVKQHDDINELIDLKTKNTILWVGRLINLKHPEAAIIVAKKLKNAKIEFELNIIGAGELYDSLKKLIFDEGLESCVNLLGTKLNDEAREYMEKSEIFLFTSNRGEGWGAVLNEAMSSGCAVIGSHSIGSVPFLIEDNKNGFIYESGNIEALFRKTKYLIENPQKRKDIGKNAYLTLKNEWNPENAVKKVISLAEGLLRGEDTSVYGPNVCDKAEILNNGWYKDTWTEDCD